MAYTRIWDDTVPTGSEAANTIAQIFRNVKSDIDERFVDIFGMASMATDPLRPYVIKFSTVPTNNDFLPGAASGFRFRDIANANTNLSIADNGNVGIRGTLGVTGAITGTLTAGAQTGITAVGTLTGLTVDAGAGSTTLNLSNLTGVSGSVIRLGSGSGFNSWIIATQFNFNNTLEFTPSTLVGGNSYTTAALSIATNLATFRVPITVTTGTASFQAITGTTLATSSNIQSNNGTLILTNAAATNRQILLRTAGVNRWGIFADSSAESGSNAGTNFILNSYDDAGVSIAAVITVTRATSLVSFSNSISVTSTVNTSKLQVNGSGLGFTAASIYINTGLGLVIGGITGSTNDLTIVNNAGATVIQIPAGTQNASFAGGITVITGGLALNSGVLNVLYTASGIATFTGSAVDPRVVICRNDNAGNNLATILLGTNNSGFFANNAFIRSRQGSGIDSWSLEFGASNTGSGGVAQQLMTIDVSGGIVHSTKSSFSGNITLGTNSAINNGSATVSIASGVATTVGTIVTPSTGSSYIVTAFIDNAIGGSVSVGSMIVTYSPLSAIWIGTMMGTVNNISAISMSGANIQVTQNSGAAKNVTVTWTKLG